MIPGTALLHIFLLLINVAIESREIMVNNYHGWTYEFARASGYKDYHSGYDIQYPLADIHVTYGDVLVFKRRDSWPPDDLYLVPQEVYQNCNFSYPYVITNVSSLFLAGKNQLYCDPGTDEYDSGCRYEFLVEKHNTNDNSLLSTLKAADTLYFTSSYGWDGNNTKFQSCKGGLKIKVHIEQYSADLTGITYYSGGYYGWYYRTTYPDLYPFLDVYVTIGDTVFFTSQYSSTTEDLWLVTDQVYDTCNFTNETIQLATSYFLRSTKYTRNESCTAGVDGCSPKGWIINSYPYNELGGYSFVVQDWHVEEWGNPLYFASARDWNRWDNMYYHGCLNGIKLRVFIEGKCLQRATLDQSDPNIQTYFPGDHTYGWYYRSTNPELYPFTDLYVSVGDTLFFTSQYTTSEDLWLVPYQVYQTCNFTSETNQFQLAVANLLRGGTYTRNESCTPDDGCNENQTWVINTYPYNELGGYSFVVQDWHVERFGNILYFASARNWDRWDYMTSHGCLNGVKLRVFVEGTCLQRGPIVEDPADASTTTMPETSTTPSADGVNAFWEFICVEITTLIMVLSM